MQVAYIGEHKSDFVIIYTPSQDADIEQSLYAEETITPEPEVILQKKTPAIYCLLDLTVKPTTDFTTSKWYRKQFKNKKQKKRKHVNVC